MHLYTNLKKSTSAKNAGAFRDMEATGDRMTPFVEVRTHLRHSESRPVHCGLIAKSRLILIGLILGIFVCSCQVFLQAQNSTGSVVGLVTDATGAAIPGAHVVLSNTATGEVQNANTRETGNYTFLNLKPGPYQIKVDSTGFKTFVQSNMDVQIGGTLRVNAQLEIGQERETITVTSAPPDLQTDSADLGGVVEQEQIQHTPLNGRNVNNLLTLVPGVVAGGGTTGNTAANYAGGAMTQPIAYGNYQIGGGFGGQSSFYVDGAQVNLPANNVDALVPTQDTVQEFRVSTNNVSAEFGGFAGGVINFGTKSGTNDFHGSAYEYVRNTVFDANNWFSNHENLDRTPLHQNQYGLNAGGPIHRNRTFGFFSWEHERVTSETPATYTLPTSDEINGDFSGVAGSSPIYDIYSAGTPQFSCNGVLNKICPDRIDPSAKAIIKATYPTPISSAYSSNYSVSSKTSGWQDQYDARIDHHIGEKNSFFGRYSYWDPNSGPNDPWNNKTGLAGTNSTTQQVVLGDTQVIKPNLIADVRVSYLRNEAKQMSSTYNWDMSPFGSNYSALQTEFGGGVLPYISLNGYSSTGGNLYMDWTNNLYTLNASMTWIAGHHTVKFGGISRQVAWTTTSAPGANVSFTTSTAFTALSSVSGSGNALASFLLGYPLSTTNSQLNGTHSFLHSYGLFVTDTWQVTPKLTATLGLRWDQPSAYSEKDNLNSVFLPNAASTLGKIYNPVTSSDQNLVGNLALVDSSAYASRRMENLHWDLFDPRIGFAYRVNDKTVVRLGYGISHLPSSMSQDGPDMSPINAASTTLSNVAGGTTETTVSNPFPTGVILSPGRSTTGINNLLGQAVSGEVPDNAQAYVQQFNLTFERTLDSNTTVSIAYAGAKGTHLFLEGAGTWSTRNLNQLPSQYFSMGSDLLNTVNNPFYGSISSGSLSGATVMKGYLLRPYPQYLNVLKRSPREGASTYHSLQTSLNRKVGASGIVGVAFTWAKLLSNTDNVSSFMEAADSGSVGLVQDNNNLRSEKSLSLQDYPFNLQISYSLQLPFGNKQRFLNHAGYVVTPIVSDWRISGITTFRSGAPIALEGLPNALSTYFGASNSTYGGLVRPNVVQGCNKKSGRSVNYNGTVKWFNTACYTDAGSYELGNESRTDSELRADNEKNFDVSLIRTFPINNKMKFDFSSEFYNIFNRKQFAQPESWTFQSTFGQVTSQANNPRLMQFALRLSF